MRAKILENVIIMSRLLQSFSRISFRSNSSSSSSSRNSNLLNDQDNQTQEVAPKHNLFDEEVRFEDINQNMDDWNIPEIPQDQLYVPETIKDKHNFDYIIKIVENNIPLGQDIGEEFHLLSKNSIHEHSRKYKYLHIGCVEVAIKPLIDIGIDATVLMCLRDIRHNKFEDSLIGTVETSLGQGPVYFSCYPNKTVSLMDRNILDSLFLNIHFHGLDMKEGSIPAALIYRIQYKVMNTCASRVLLQPQKGETTLFITDMTKSNVSLKRIIKWDEVTLPEKWVMEKATPSDPRPAPIIEDIKQDNSEKVEITFNRRNSFSSRIEASRFEYESARRSFSVRTRSIPVGLARSELHNQFPTINLQGIDTTSSIPRTTYNQDQEDDQKSIQSPTYSSMEPYDGTNKKQIQDKFYKFVERVKVNVLFFDWFHAYSIKNDIDYPWKQDIIGDPSTNVITNWQVRYGEIIQSELPPTTKYQLPNIKDSNNKPVMATPFKTKDINEEVTSEDIKSLMEQANYTNKYLQILGETIKTKIPDAVNTLIFTIAQHFIGDPSLWKDRSAELLSNLKCRTLADFRWYRDTFLTRVYTREDSQQPFWKEKFLAGFPRSLGDKVRDKIRSQSANGDIPYENLSYGQLISYVQKVALKICQDDKIQRQLAKEKAQTKRDLACPKQKKKQTSRKEIQDHKPANRRRFSKRRYTQKPSTSHISKYCRLKKKLRNLNLEPTIEEQINNLLIETSEEETKTSSSALSDEDLNLIQQDDQLSSTDDEDRQINTLTREQDLLFEAINSIPPPGKEEVKPRQKDFITNNKFDVSNILKRLENSSTKPTTIQDLHTEISNLKREVKELRQQQEIHQIILSQLEEESDSKNTNSEENQPENLEDDMFMGLINMIKIQNFYINIKIIINDFVLETMALFDTGADSNCILEGLIPTKFFEKTSEKLSTANGSKLKINFKLSNAIIENQGLRINTNFLLVKNLKNEVILGTPFIRALFPIQISNEGITTKVLAIFLCISKFQSNLLNQKFLVRVDCKSAKDILQKDTRSSTQKGKLEGSLTQITTVKPESSTQESPKPTTTKQTVADYAWSIQTFSALEDIGLTKVPKLAKKTWAEMASESNDDSETDLQKQIQKAKQTKTVCNQKPSQSLTQQESTPQPNNSYISKNKFFNVLQMEPEYWDKNPFKATAKVFPPGFHYRPTATNKTRKFYEFILIDTNSVSIKHFKDPKDPNLNTHSTIQILKVMQPRHYGSNLNQPKKFSAPFDPAGYNYWDYIDAWTNVFWHQNSKFKHSWLIYFKNNTVYNFPNWFLQWWNYFGPIPQIFPEEVQQGFQQFNKLYNSKESRIPADLKYFSSFSLSWIFSWQYRYGKTENSKQYPPLQRHAFVKWWSQFDTSKAAPEQVKNWFQSNPEFLKPVDPETSLFLNQKSQLAAFLASSKSKESLA
ncbi:hypothetical protein JHK87_000755 [Glycine soja]|nr:hypothetical protein JHK87_000755 [Glycine soja]